MKEALKWIVDARGHDKDFLAFLVIAIVSAICLTLGVPLASVGFLIFLLWAGWVISRYALIRIQSREQLWGLKVNTKGAATDLLERHAGALDHELAQATQNDGGSND